MGDMEQAFARDNTAVLPSPLPQQQGQKSVMNQHEITKQTAISISLPPISSTPQRIDFVSGKIKQKRQEKQTRFSPLCKVNWL
jgi:hypothetical protein